MISMCNSDGSSVSKRTRKAVKMKLILSGSSVCFTRKAPTCTRTVR